MPHASRSDDRLVVAPSQPLPGLLLVRLLGDLGPRDAQRCTRILRGAVDAAAAEHATRGARARVVCDVTEVEVLDGSATVLLADVETYARFHGVEFAVETRDDPASGPVSPAVPAAR